MFEKLSQLAESSATSASRRQFLGRLGRGAMAATAALGGLLAFAGDAQAARRIRMCSTESSNTQCQGVPYGSPCVIDDGPGTCVSSNQIQVEPGVYDCNWCKPKGRKKDDGR